VPMFPTTILVGVDGTEPSSVALHAATELAAATGSTLHVAHVKLTRPPLRPQPTNPEQTARMQQEGTGLLERCEREVSDLGGRVERTHLRASGRVDRELLDLQADLGAGLLMVGTGGSGRTARRLAAGLGGRGGAALLVVAG
jgi:nucleotide-binding universal stress UspA family protein